MMTRRDVLSLAASLTAGSLWNTRLLADPDKTGTDLSDIDAFFKRSLDDLGGGGALVLYHGGELVYARGFGKAKGKGSWTTRTVVPIGSSTKWMSGGVILSLVESGLLSLDDTAGKYLPGFKGDKGNITIRQMFSHTHGFPEGPQVHRDTTLTMEEAVRRISEIKLAHVPGTKLHYSGLGMQVAGYIATRVTKKPWVELFRERIGDPLEMKDTDYYAFGKTDNPNVAGSVQTSAEDYSHFTRMVLDKGVFKGR
ncbi:MAG: beta-lactamase family protein, partial [Nevskiales bacterium]|nr:beta-lactamase family protein [Nevskiales bacterium]